MDKLYIFLFVALLFGLFRLYFLIARRFNIVDVPNHRTMHEGATIRGGGIVLWIAGLLLGIFYSMDSFFLAGLFLMGLTGFLDDLFDLNSALRFFLQGLSIAMMLYHIPFDGVPFWLIVMLLVVGVGVLNAFNFMDGINGITGGYTMVFLLTAIFLNNRIAFVNPEFLYGMLAAVLVFNFYNFRQKARCFAGDVGSLTIAFIVIYLLILLVLKTGEWTYVLFLLLYGMDTVFTILQRLYLRENIFQAHRLHLFQIGIRGTGMSHLRMSWIFMAIQGVVNFLIIYTTMAAPSLKWVCAVCLVIVFSIVYIVLKRKLWAYR